MLSPLVFVLALSGFLLLVIGERMGLSAAIGGEAANLIVVGAMVVLGLGGVTSRFERFATGSRLGKERIWGLGARSACLLVLVLAYSGSAASSQAVWIGFALGFVLAHLGQFGTGLPSSAQEQAEASALARIARLAGAIAMMVLLAMVMAPLCDALARASGLPLGVVRPVALVLAASVLLPGGAVGVKLVQGVVLALGVALALVPALSLLGLALVERVDALILESLPRLSVPEVSTLSVMTPGTLLGLAAGYGARGRGAIRLAPAGAGLALGMLLAAVLVGLNIFAQEWLARIVGGRIVGVAPQSWPGFVFDEEIRGWLRACGAAVPDPLAAARACGFASPAQVLKPADLSVLGSLSSAALARSAGLPLVVGGLWLLLPPLIGFAGVLSLLHAVALGMSEALLFRTFNPTGLRSWRLAMARLAVLVVLAGVAAATMAWRWPVSLDAILAAALGVALVAGGWAAVRPAREAA